MKEKHTGISLQKNDTLMLTVEGYNDEGLGVARQGREVVFVHRGLRWETALCRIEKVGKNYAYARVLSCDIPSPHRTEPDCPYYGRCGGCDFRHMDYAEELAAKHRRVQDALERLGGSGVVVEEILGAPTQARYRNKSLYPIAADGTVGFYRARTHDVQTVETCLLQKETADAAAASLRQYIKAYDVPCYDETAHRGLLRHLFVRTNAKGACLICLFVNGDRLPHEPELVELLRQNVPSCVGIVLGMNTRKGNAITAESYHTLWGENTLADTLCGLQFRLSVPSFYQVNREQAEVLYHKAVEFAGLTGQETLLDLYCGAGTITQVMAQYCKRAIGAEIVPEAIENAKKSAAENGVENVEFFCGDAKAVAEKFAAEGLKPDVICVDPPRKGLAPEVVESVCAMAPKRVVYVSCDPATLGRDVKRFAQLGYTCIRAAAVDLFPRTANVESVILLQKKE